MYKIIMCIIVAVVVMLLILQLAENAYMEISGRWNVNDAGDIYFIPCKSVTEALQKAEEFNSELYKTQWLKGSGLTAAQRKVIEKNINEHHLYSRTAKIVGECFTVL